MNSTWQDYPDTTAKPNVATPITTFVGVAAVCFLLTGMVSVWSAYEALGPLLRLGLIGIGLWVMFAIAWRSRYHPKTSLSLVGLGCALLAAGIGAAYLLSFTQNSGMVASSLIVLLPLSVSSLRWHQHQHQRTPIQIGLFALGIAGIAFVLCFERTAWIGLCAGLLCAGYVHWRFNDKPKVYAFIYPLADAVLVFGLLIGLLIYWQLLTNPSLDPWFKATPLGSALWERVPLWRESLGLIQDYYFTGSGLGETAMIYSTYVYLLHVPFLYHAHNLYLQIAVEQGAPGLIAFLCLALPMLGSLIATYRQVGHYSRLFCLAAIASIVGLLFYGLLDSEIYATAALPLLFVPFGYGLALHWSLLYRGKKQTAAEYATWQAPQPHHNAWWVAGLPVVLIAIGCFHPGFWVTWQANLGTVAQTKAELSEYDWPRWPLQDELRRSNKVNLTTALAYYHTVLGADPNNVTAHARLGQIALSRGDYASAMQQLEAAYAVAPQRSAVRQLLGEAYAATGHVKEAVLLWQTVDTHAGQLSDRLWWYTHLNAQHEVAWIKQAIALTR